MVDGCYPPLSQFVHYTEAIETFRSITNSLTTTFMSSDFAVLWRLHIRLARILSVATMISVVWKRFYKTPKSRRIIMTIVMGLICNYSRTNLPCILLVWIIMWCMGYVLFTHWHENHIRQRGHFPLTIQCVKYEQRRHERLRLDHRLLSTCDVSHMFEVVVGLIPRISSEIHVRSIRFSDSLPFAIKLCYLA